MARAVVLINKSTGSDSCGNATLRGTNASTSGDGLTVTLDGSPDLSGVATDGSAWIQLLDATAGARNFAKITGKDNVAKTVTVQRAFAFSLTAKTWAINQTLASITAANSRKLIENNASTGDAGADEWTVRMESGHTETLTSTLAFRVGDATTGPFIFEGDPDAVTRPVITGVSTNTQSIRVAAVNANVIFQNFDLVGNTVQTKSGTTASGIDLGQSPCYATIRNVRIGGTADNQGFYRGIVQGSAGHLHIENVTIKHCYDAAAQLGNGTNGSYQIDGLYIDECDHGAGNGHGLVLTNRVFAVSRLVVARCRGDGVRLEQTTTATSFGSLIIDGFTIYDCGGDGIEITHSNTQTGLRGLRLTNGSITHCTGYGINFSGSGITADVLAALCYRYNNINYGTGGSANTSGDCNVTLDSRIENGKLQVDPAYTDPDNATQSSRNFTPGTNLRAAGWPSSSFPGSATRTYVDVGGVQRQEPASGGVVGLI